MGLVPRLILAVVAALFGVMMIAIAPPTDKAVFFYGFGTFCVAIAVACVTRGRTAEFFGSFVGLVVFGLGVWYIGSVLLEGELWSGRKSQPSLINALLFMGVFGVPAALYVYHVRFGFRGRRRTDSDAPGPTGRDEP